MSTWSYAPGGMSPGQIGAVPPRSYYRGTREPDLANGGMDWYAPGGVTLGLGAGYDYGGGDVRDMGLPTFYPGARTGVEQDWANGVFA